MKKTKFKGFYETLRETIGEQKDQMYWEIIKYSASFFKLLCNVLVDKRTGWHTKLVINSALSYFVVPNDIISEEEYGAVGYVDDVFLCAYVLKGIKEQISEEILIDNWKEKGDIIEIVEEVFSGSKKIIRDKYKEILEFSGLRKQDAVEPEEEILPELIKKL
jgi:uncharacterized membrane protein YkvA (DUF1232 family)